MELDPGANAGYMIAAYVVTAVILAGYGSDMTDERAFGFRDLTRAGDAFFAKVSWLFRM